MTDTERLDLLEELMTPNSDYCEIFFAGLRDFKSDKAEAFQIESNPQKFQTRSASTLRGAIDLALDSIGKRPEMGDVEASCEADLKEIAHYYGGWNELKEVINRLEETANEEAAERWSENKYEGDGNFADNH